MPRGRTLIALAAVAALVAAAVVLFTAGPARLDLDDPARIAAGAPIYTRHCAACHGANLEGQPDWKTPLATGRMPAPPHDDSGHTWHHTLDVLFGITRQGVTPPYGPPGYQSDMPAFAGTLDDDAIWNVLAFIRSRWSPAVRAKNDELNRR